MMESLSPVAAGALGSLAAGMMTAVGAVPMLFLKRPGEQTQSVLLGFAAGVMLAASFFSLIIPGVDVLQAGGASQARAAGTMAAAVLIGATVIGLMNRFAPVDMLAIGPAQSRHLARRIWLFIIAITLHNFPEGAAVGVSFGGGDTQQGLATALGIGIQNMPEGLAVFAAMASLGYGRWAAFAGALASGLVEPVGGLIGASVVHLLPGALPWGLGLAAGAMIYVVTAEIIPETRERSKGEGSMIGLMIGLVGMMFLDIALG
jgi:zinc transporter, ZIP family